MANKFDQRIVIDTPSKNVFNLSYRSRLSAVMGQIIPVLHKEVVPGDRWRVGFQSLIRLAPLKAPIFDGVKADFHAFFVPNRILDPKWKQFITGGNSLNVGQADAEIDPLRFKANDYFAGVFQETGENRGFHISSLFDYLNLHVAQYNTDGVPADRLDEHVPTIYPDNVYLSALPVLGYHKVWSDWYRNERIENGIALGGDDFTGLFFDTSDDRYLLGIHADGVNFVSITDSSNLFDQLHWRNYKKDRYTTALPEPVIGGPVVIPGSGGSSGDVTLDVSKDDAFHDIKDPAYVVVGSVVAGVSRSQVNVGSLSPNGGNEYYMGVTAADGDALQSVITQQSLASAFDSKQFVTDVSISNTQLLANAAQATIQELKTAFKMYSFFMKDTYNGNRYVEFMESHHNVRVPDATIDRAIYLGGSTVPIQFGEVFQTSGATGESGDNTLGDYAGRGVGAGADFLFDDTFLEHGQLYVMMSIVPNNSYFQGIDPKFIKNDRFDYFTPEFQNIGDVAVRNAELYFGSSDVDSPVDFDDVFGYQSRWYDLKQFNDELHGDFLPNSTGEGSNMSFWNFSRQFADTPKLSPEFSNVKPQNAPFAVVDEWSDNYLIDIQWNIKALRQIMYYESF